MATFVNELGNEITVEVEAKELDTVPGVLITITGPNSVSENHITKKEAEVLLENLSSVLKV